MHFLTYQSNGQEEIGLLTADQKQIIPLLAAEHHFYGETILPTTLLSLIQQGELALQRVKSIVKSVEAQSDLPFLLSPDNIRIVAPIPRPAKNIFCIGKNYAEHAMEGDTSADPSVAIPKYPVIFTKAPTTVIGPGDIINSHSQVTNALDYEVELAVIIGKKASYVSKEEAMDYVFGYTILNDVTARDLQKRHQQWFRGKSLDTTAPMGPFLVHKTSVPSVNDLTVTLKVNGELRQHANTNSLIFDIPTLISTISSGITLEPGDIISTGTPAGVGAYSTPPVFLKPGDKLELSITGLGTLINTVG
ncbi:MULTISPECIES: fumarylacetoacetate hydrolase family protein [Pelosinus]|jgi:2-keto-4-pentenoate hydratase/2-oxohepta-3-ene-1,7-dioic acid hydratase in catechol pathway|uniref:Fumarylacetoacetate (FAA) hydrolase n=1 Tax=Pelosinus fermentans B4 TaxID=1149862 RepID=I8RDK4_9FIRM|nr:MULTISPECIES: fumarylacetoacetate hydrolase family protein [Pelosinus]EIW15545.1 fumarylacetoacetate (FAA) hydrolase [Pelosinus fermentans B4]EIW26765.1 fumarylacetoacetate (FAA) hydrolase [Pelosinus fermentans A11]OAM92289.1 Ureidoglycolate lyase [Pelosinus fermentans DSM 17108]SDQ39759.1 2-keto-4-pentenoate hydratase/2-oxohepta-3-ene-1,7-dioic acid hydratase (catechol pathway) [Pelosinus fermentans]